jgi:hypothetical protein
MMPPQPTTRISRHVLLGRRLGCAVNYREIADRAATRFLQAMLGQMLVEIIQVDGALSIPHTSSPRKSLSREDVGA